MADKQEELEKVVNVEQFVDVDTRERVESQVHRASERKDMVLLGMTWSRHKTKPEKGEELSKAPKALIEALRHCLCSPRAANQVGRLRKQW